MGQNVVYKITRTDGLEYIGITNKMKTRMYYHKKSARFSKGISNIQILRECTTYQEAELLEESFISLYDTYHNGLNITIDGKGKNGKEVKFNTLGHVYSEESRKKMRESSKKRFERMIPGSLKGRKHSNKTKKNLSDKRKGISWGPRTIPMETIMLIRKEYKNRSRIFDLDFIKDNTKLSDHDKIGNIPLEQLRMKSGHQLTYIRLLSIYYATKLNMTRIHISNILKEKSYVTKHCSEL